MQPSVTTQVLPDIEHYLHLQFDQFEIIGRGIAGIESVYSVPQWGLTFDTGRCPHFAYNNGTLALTHWHLDHAGGVANYLGLRCLGDQAPLRIVVPEPSHDRALEYLQALKRVSDSNIRFDVLKASGEISIKRNLFLKPITSYHSIDSTGYGVYENKSVLKAEFAGLEQEKIRDLKMKGVAIEDEVRKLRFAYSGDSRGEFLAGEAASAEVLLMECTFFDDDGNYESIRKYGHAHIRDWQKYAEGISSRTVIMTHTSQRYSLKEVETACYKHLPKSLTDRLVIFRK